MIVQPIPHSSIDEQIKKLEKQNLIINDKVYARYCLTTYGYSNLIKSYREPYVVMQNGKKQFRSGVTFEQVTSLYLLDKELRNSVMAAMLDFEEYIKENTADVIASSFGTDHNAYLKFSNYRDKKRKKYRFSLKGILSTMQKTVQSDKNPIKHYREEYGIVPPWILFKNVYFTTIINYISLLKPAEQLELTHKIYDSKKLGLSDEGVRKLLLDTLFICSDYRNNSAHGGRIYNNIPKSTLRADEIFLINDFDETGIGLLLFLLKLIKYGDPFKRLNQALEKEVNRHCGAYPQDITYLGQILNINIIPTHNVYISTNPANKKYHANMHCSGMMNGKCIELEVAKQNGYIPCKKCCL